MGQQHLAVGVEQWGWGHGGQMLSKDKLSFLGATCKGTVMSIDLVCP